MNKQHLQAELQELKGDNMHLRHGYMLLHNYLFARFYYLLPRRWAIGVIERDTTRIAAKYNQLRTSRPIHRKDAVQSIKNLANLAEVSCTIEEQAEANEESADEIVAEETKEESKQEQTTFAEINQFSDDLRDGGEVRSGNGGFDLKKLCLPEPMPEPFIPEMPDEIGESPLFSYQNKKWFIAIILFMTLAGEYLLYNKILMDSLKLTEKLDLVFGRSIPKSGLMAAFVFVASTLMGFMVHRPILTALRTVPGRAINTVMKCLAIAAAIVIFLFSTLYYREQQKKADIQRYNSLMVQSNHLQSQPDFKSTDSAYVVLQHNIQKKVESIENEPAILEGCRFFVISFSSLCVIIFSSVLGVVFFILSKRDSLYRDYRNARNEAYHYYSVEKSLYHFSQTHAHLCKKIMLNLSKIAILKIAIARQSYSSTRSTAQKAAPVVIAAALFLASCTKKDGKDITSTSKAASVSVAVAIDISASMPANLSTKDEAILGRYLQNKVLDSGKTSVYLSFIHQQSGSLSNQQSFVLNTASSAIAPEGQSENETAMNESLEKNKVDGDKKVFVTKIVKGAFAPHGISHKTAILEYLPILAANAKNDKTALIIFSDMIESSTIRKSQPKSLQEAVIMAKQDLLKLSKNYGLKAGGLSNVDEIMIVLPWEVADNAHSLSLFVWRYWNDIFKALGVKNIAVYKED